MKIGIDGSRAFMKSRTGIEEYSYQIIKHLRENLTDHQVVLYLRKGQSVDFELPEKWIVKELRSVRLWTQFRLSLEMLLYAPDLLLVPAHTVPFIHPKRSIVVVHGLEYEFVPSAYSFWERFYMRLVIKNSCRWASKIISVSENTKRDLINLYKVSDEKIQVVYEGFSVEHGKLNMEKKDDRMLIVGDKYLLFIGRIEERKNVANIIKAFEILKEKYGIEHKLVLAGKPGYGYQAISLQLSASRYKEEIKELGFVSEEEKWELLKKADVFVFPTLYEGFGIPILEAQSVGCPVVASDNSSIPEVVADSAILVDPLDPREIMQGICDVLSDDRVRDDIIKRGLENAQRFSWQYSAAKISANILE